MKIENKSKEDLLHQAEGFIASLSQKGEISEKTKEKIFDVLEKNEEIDSQEILDTVSNIIQKDCGNKKIKNIKEEYIRHLKKILPTQKKMKKYFENLIEKKISLSDIEEWKEEYALEDIIQKQLNIYTSFINKDYKVSEEEKHIIENMNNDIKKMINNQNEEEFDELFEKTLNKYDIDDKKNIDLKLLIFNDIITKTLIQKEYKQIQNLLQSGFELNISNLISLIQKKYQYLIDQDTIQKAIELEKKGFTREEIIDNFDKIKKLDDTTIRNAIELKNAGIGISIDHFDKIEKAKETTIQNAIKLKNAEIYISIGHFDKIEELDTTKIDTTIEKAIMLKKSKIHIFVEYFEKIEKAKDTTIQNAIKLKNAEIDISIGDFDKIEKHKETTIQNAINLKNAGINVSVYSFDKIEKYDNTTIQNAINLKNAGIKGEWSGEINLNDFDEIEKAKDTTIQNAIMFQNAQIEEGRNISINDFDRFEKYFEKYKDTTFQNAVVLKNTGIHISIDDFVRIEKIDDTTIQAYSNNKQQLDKIPTGKGNFVTIIDNVAKYSGDEIQAIKTVREQLDDIIGTKEKEKLNVFVLYDIFVQGNNTEEIENTIQAIGYLYNTIGISILDESEDYTHSSYYDDNYRLFVLKEFLRGKNIQYFQERKKICIQLKKISHGINKTYFIPILTNICESVGSTKESKNMQKAISCMQMIKETLKKELDVKNHAIDSHIGEYLTPYYISILNNIDKDDIMLVIKKIQEAKAKIHDSIILKEHTNTIKKIILLADSITNNEKYKEKINTLHIETKDYIDSYMHIVDMMFLNLEDLSFDNESDSLQENKRTYVHNQIKNKIPNLDKIIKGFDIEYPVQEMIEQFLIDNQNSGRDRSEYNERIIAPLYYLSQNTKNIKKIINKIFHIDNNQFNFDTLLRTTQIIMNCKLQEKLEAIEPLCTKTKITLNDAETLFNKEGISLAYIKRLVKLHEETGFNIIDAFNNWRYGESKIAIIILYFQDQKTYNRAKELGFFTELDDQSGDQTSYLYKHKKIKYFFDNYSIKTFLEDAKQKNNIKKLKEILSLTQPENLQIILDNVTKDPIKLGELQKVLVYAQPENLKNWVELLQKVSLDISEIIETLNNLYRGGLLTNSNISKKNIEKLQGYNPEESKEYIDLIVDTNKTSYNQDKKISMIEKIFSLSLPQAREYLEVFQVLDESISPDVQHIKNELIDEVLLSDNPKEIAQKINDIFIKNNLPLVGKIFKVFVELYKEERFNKELHKAKTSPILNSIKNFKKQQALIYKDLMNITIKSGNISLREYIDIFVGAEESIKKFETIIKNIDYTQELPLEGVLTEKEQEKLLYVFRKLDTLYETNSGNVLPEPENTEILKLGQATVDDKKLIEYYKNIKKRFLVKEDESLYDNLIKFLRPLGYTSFKEVKQEMEKSKQQAHQRGLEIYQEAMNDGGKVSLKKGDFIKGIQNTKIIENILERGCTSREYLGGGDESGSGKAGSDMTPFDIDGGSVTEELSQYNFSEILSKSVSGSYGSGGVTLVIKNKRGKLYNTREQEIQGYTKNKYEVFQTGGNDHYGIRTGIPSTEIDFLIWNGDSNSQNKEFEKICYEIAKNGFYIPIVNREGTIIFTPKMYHTMKKTFIYCERYPGYDVLQEGGLQKTKEQDNAFSIVQSDTKLGEIFWAHSPNNNKYKEFAQQNKELALSTMEKIKTILEEKCEIKFNSEFDTAIVGAKIHDSGSTGRGTDVPTKDVDLDFTLLLDSKDYDEKLEDIIHIIHQEIGTTKKNHERTITNGYQIKSEKNSLGDRPDGIALDLLIMKKTQVIEYSSSDAASDRLEYIKQKYGEKAIEQVRTNIIIMKKLLKAKSCYKKPEGGFGGIGVENRILQHHGNFIEALESFEKIAYGGQYQEGKNPISLQEFQGKYPIYDVGENYKDGGKDNFVFRMKEKGYNGILEIIKEYRTHGLKGIEKILDQYLQNKAEFGAI